MGLRVAEVSEHAFAQVSGDMAAGADNLRRAAFVVDAEDLAEVLRIQPLGERSRTQRSQKSTVSCRRSVSSAAGDLGDSTCSCSGGRWDAVLSTFSSCATAQVRR